MNNERNFQIDSKHPDLAFLCKFTNTDPEDLRGSSHGGPNGYTSNYMKVQYLRYWSKGDIEELEKQFAQANENTTEYTFVLENISDYEVEYDNDRSWPASFGIKSIKK
jgi:hypothetical protein